MTNWLEIAENVLIKANALAPSRAPDIYAMPEKKQNITVAAWAEALSSMPVPENVFSEAVVWWSSNKAQYGALTPQGLKEAAAAVRDRWESDPRRRRELERIRELRQEERDQRIGLIVGGERRALE